MCLYFSQSHNCVTFIEKNYKLKINKNVLGPTGPISCKNVTENCFSYKLRFEVQLISDGIIVDFALYFYNVKVNFKLGTKFIYDV